jgi:hypothetical protein
MPWQSMNENFRLCGLLWLWLQSNHHSVVFD